MSQQEEKDQYIDPNEVQEVVEETGDAEPIEEDDEVDEVNPDGMEQDDDDDGEDTIEIDMSNNSSGYFDTHTDSVFTVFSHPTLPLVVSGGADNTAYLWTTHTQEPKIVAELKGHGESVIAGGFTGDGAYVITGDMAGKVNVYKSFKRGQKWEPYGSVEQVEEVTWIKVHPKQPFFAFGGADGSVWCYQIEPSLEQVFSGFSHQADCTNGEFVNVDDLDSLDLVSVSEDGSIISWNCYTGQANYKIAQEQFKGQTPAWVNIAVHETAFAVTSRDAQVAVLNVQTGSIITVFKAVDMNSFNDELDASIEAISWCSLSNLSLMAVGLVSGDVVIFDTNTWRPRRNIKVGDAVTKLFFIPQTPYLVGATIEGKIYKWDARTGEELFVGVGHHMGVLDFAVQEGGNRLITAGDEGVSLIFNI
ncbi:unnamed protein product [Kuraishia capsulata CBS 1993]|uniref:Uncharacterized protein n=1 Tax=Kuraishia capsulata CBS 1993 TaxID=1382522 RepID=W6MXC9_9ASCO|nr:uncharacterized protein KUCA_T00004654001 [Kuraishia capsulata CBS 1993]CDK28670.1 unnamed protein product [Kuraishia capsulata CBS 1993]